MIDRALNFTTTWLRTSWEIIKAFIQSANEAKISKLRLLWSSLQQFWEWACFLIKTELLNSLSQVPYNNETTEEWLSWETSSVVEEVKNKVAILIPWYNLTDKSLVWIKSELEKRGIIVEALSNRVRDSQDILAMRRKIWDIIDAHEWKEKVLFGYSSGWIIAHKIWETLWIPSVSFATPSNTQSTMITTLLELFWNAPKKDIKIPENAINLIEEFSEMVPHTWDLPERTEKIPWVYSHMSVNQPVVITRVSDEIEKRFSQV